MLTIHHIAHTRLYKCPRGNNIPHRNSNWLKNLTNQLPGRVITLQSRKDDVTIHYAHYTNKSVVWKWSYDLMVNSVQVCHLLQISFIIRGSYRKSWATFFFLHANWEQQTKESAVIDGTSCCVILECLVTPIACITWLISLLTKWPTTICCFASVLSSNSLRKRKSLLQKFTRDFSVLMEVCAWVRAVYEDGWNILKMGKRRQFRKQCVSVFG